jgi:transcription termination factor Rho
VLDESGAELERKPLAQLHELAAERGIARFRTLRREQLIEAIRDRGGGALEIDELEALERPGRQGLSGSPAPGAVGDLPDPRAEEEEEAGQEPCAGVLDVVPDGFGFLRVDGFSRSDDDVFVSRSQVRRFGLRPGDEVSGRARPRGRSQRHASLAAVDAVNGRPPESSDDGARHSFERLTAVQPAQAVRLAHDPGDLAVRMVDLVAPLSLGQRLIVAGPPRTGATALLRQIVDAAASSGEIVPIGLLVDARPEETTDWRRAADYPVLASSGDRSADAHVEFALLALERARRLVEQGDDVLLALDSLTRLGRAYGLARPRRGVEEQPAEDEIPGSGVQFAKRWFAAGRATEEAGSLTIVATARAGSGSATEELLYEGVADVASAELRLSPELAGAGLEPAIDVRRSYSRADASGRDGETLRRLRASLVPLPAAEAWSHLAEQIRDTESNERLLRGASGLS